MDGNEENPREACVDHKYGRHWKIGVVGELAARGHRAVDLDTPEWSEWIDVDPSDTLTPGEGKDWVWREKQSEHFSPGTFSGFRSSR